MQSSARMLNGGLTKVKGGKRTEPEGSWTLFLPDFSSERSEFPGGSRTLVGGDFSESRVARSVTCSGGGEGTEKEKGGISMRLEGLPPAPLSGDYFPFNLQESPGRGDDGREGLEGSKGAQPSDLERSGDPVLR